ncbi:hypothetical protein Aple_020640 [Acrocarpospora pleiomorpha]|uniref:Uncharacterized protein n=1 Tax=Acrocarpospora pleiomorpha TaxID=90975 RepID=A0A5M3XLX5_9ACTN|nr:hypothetical protein Aple_020640 [Acrocarpospora pleiomorpha]
MATRQTRGGMLRLRVGRGYLCVSGNQHAASGQRYEKGSPTWGAKYTRRHNLSNLHLRYTER